MPKDSLPLCVDMDGTLVRTDTLLELVLLFVKKYPRQMWRPLWWLRRGKAYMKNQLSQRVALVPGRLPYNQELVAYLKKEKGRGRQLYLVTASAHAVAQAVAGQLGIFAEVIGSTAQQNYKGKNKAKLLTGRFGKKGFAYAGDSYADLAVWKEASEGVVVSSRPALIKAAKKVTHVSDVFAGPTVNLAALLQAIRAHQWVKNILLFLPIIAAHRILERDVLGATIIAFVSFSLAASSVYVLNDLLDLDADRRHATKRNRPFTAGRLPLGAGLALIPLLLIGSLGLASLLPVRFGILLAAYLFLTLCYSWYLKRVVLVDVVLLSLFYTLRMLAGAAAGGIVISSWLMTFALFLFLSLALIKRYTELYRLRDADQKRASGRGYVVSDLELLSQLGTASGYLAALVLALYISSHEVTVLYQHSQRLWLILPIFMYWISRVWLFAHRGALDGDPVLGAVKDRVSYLVALALLIILLIAR